MSHRHHPPISNEVAHIVTDLKNLNKERVRELYNAEVLEDGQVYDLAEDELYDNVVDWANHFVNGGDTSYDDLVPDKYADIEGGEDY